MGHFKGGLRIGYHTGISRGVSLIQYRFRLRKKMQTVWQHQRFNPMGVLSSGSLLLSNTFRIKGRGCGCYGVIMCLMGKSIYDL